MAFIEIHKVVLSGAGWLASVYFRGMKRDEFVEPMPGRPCLTGLNRWLI